MNCSPSVCHGSNTRVFAEAKEKLSKEEILLGAREFLQQYYKEKKRFYSIRIFQIESNRILIYVINFANSSSNTKIDFESRWSEVSASIESRGSYDLTSDELEQGCKLAWRNASRCVGRIQWKNLKLQDCRSLVHSLFF